MSNSFQFLGMQGAYSDGGGADEILQSTESSPLQQKHCKQNESKQEELPSAHDLFEPIGYLSAPLRECGTKYNFEGGHGAVQIVPPGAPK